MGYKMKIIYSLFIILTFIHYIYPNDLKVTASAFKYKVDSLAQSIDSSARLLSVKSDTVDIEGRAKYWSYCYMSTDTQKYYYFHVYPDTVIFDSTSFHIFTGVRWISNSWIDSDSAIALAEEQGGSDFRAIYQNYRIRAELDEALVPPSHPIWYINYIAGQDSSKVKLIKIDAEKYENPSSVKYLNNSLTVPTHYLLSQSYPNPFNPTATISYDLPTSSNVTLVIYNMAGQKVKTLVSNEIQNAGSYSVRWDGRNERGQAVSSGIYLYRIEASYFTATKKMVLLK